MNEGRSSSRADVPCARCCSKPSVETRSLRYGEPWCNVCWDRPLPRPRGYEAQENEHTTDVMLGRTPVPSPSKEMNQSDVCSQSEPC